jgi:N-acetylmuramoyl-L-alanine amidase
MKLILDAGHGGNDPGAVAAATEEEDLNLDLALELQSIFAARHPDWELTMTRVDDNYMSPSDRRLMCIALCPDAFISLHCNSSDNPAANGCEVVFRDWIDRTLATEVQIKLVSALGLRDRGLKMDVEDLGRKLAVLSTPGIASIIIEPGFISNSGDLALLVQKNLVARAIVEGIEAWAAKYKV